MKTKIIHNYLGNYNFLNNKDKAESYVFIFDANDRENKTVAFTFKEENAPEINCEHMLPIEILRELESYESVKYTYSSNWNHIEEKTHEERIIMALELAALNEKEDCEDHLIYLKRTREQLDTKIKLIEEKLR